MLLQILISILYELIFELLLLFSFLIYVNLHFSLRFFRLMSWIILKYTWFSIFNCSKSIKCKPSANYYFFFNIFWFLAKVLRALKIYNLNVCNYYANLFYFYSHSSILAPLIGKSDLLYAAFLATSRFNYWKANRI
jgi:hypothetical protein